jgi:CheY-like chemotaxis protein
VAEAGMDAFLVKPIQIDRLAEAIHHLTASPEALVQPFELNEIKQHDHNDEADNRQKRSHG